MSYVKALLKNHKTIYFCSYFYYMNIVIFLLSAKRLGLEWPEIEHLDLNPEDGLNAIKKGTFTTNAEYEKVFKTWRMHVRKRRARIPSEGKFQFCYFFCMFQISV